MRSKEPVLAVQDFDDSDEMIEIEYMLAAIGNKEQKKTRNDECYKKKIAALLIAVGIEAELPSAFYERLLHSNRAKVLLRTVTEGSINIIDELNKN